MTVSLVRGIALALALLATVGCGGAAREPERQAERAPATGSTEAAVGDGESSSPSFVPSTSREGDRVVLPVTFPDGTTAELVYPPKLEIAELGASPYSSGRLRGESPTPARGDLVGRDMVIAYGELDHALLSYNGGERPSLLARYEGVDGRTVGFWDFGSNLGVDYLGFQFGRWAVLVYDYAVDGHMPGAAMTDAERASWTASFSGHETTDGFLLLDGAGPLRLARAGEHAGPQLWFGSAGSPTSFGLYPGRCRPHRGQTRVVHGKLVQWSDRFADWCLSASMRIHASGPDPFVGGLIEHLRARDVALASR
jgi:hypothetical protein